MPRSDRGGAEAHPDGLAGDGRGREPGASPGVEAAEGPGRGLADAYSRTGRAWEEGPARLVYDRLAQVLVAASPVPLAGRQVLDVGAGTGAAARSIVAAGGRPVAVDVSLGMLRANTTSVGRAVVGDARRLAVRTGAVDGLVAAFSFNHLRDPATGFREARRVCRPGSPVLVAAYAADDHHPVKAAAEQAMVEAGWAPEPWYDDLRAHALPRLATVDGLRAAARSGGLDGHAEGLVVAFPELSPGDLVAWRLGMAPTAPFLAGLAPAARARVRARALALLGATPPPLQRSIVVFTGSS